MISRERRQYSRVELSWSASINTAQGLIIGEIKNISQSGALIHCRELPNPDEAFELTIEIPEYVLPILASAKIVRLDTHISNSGSPSYDLAVRFLKISEEDLRLLSHAAVS